MSKVAERVKVIDVDTHIIEPYDLWTSRLADKYDMVPHVVTAKRLPDNELMAAMTKVGDDVWIMGGEAAEEMAASPVGVYGMAGWKEPLPGHPPTINDIDPAGWDPAMRLKRMDEYGIYAQMLYPNIAGFGGAGFLRLPDRKLKQDCVRAYNDFLHDWCSQDPKRLIPIAATPFWDLEFALEEIARCARLGHKSLLFTWSPEAFGQPHLADPFWNPLWKLVTELEMPINFHIGSGVFEAPRKRYEPNGWSVNFASYQVQLSLSNAAALLEVLASRITRDFPTIKFVSVESGVGWIPFVLENLTWLWENSDVYNERPELRDTSPLEIFRKHIYSTFWFENHSMKAAIDYLGPDNIMFETDFPHPTSVAPGPNSAAKNPIDHIEDRFADSGLSEEVIHKILAGNATKLYHLD
jgi:predicted TIM-barrel fold metal-dependent hydrolase